MLEEEGENNKNLTFLRIMYLVTPELCRPIW